MNFQEIKNIKFSNYYKLTFYLSVLLISFSIVIFLFKGLNLGVDFKGGTLIELRLDNKEISISEIRQSFLKMDLGDISVQNFGQEGDFLVKIEQIENQDKNFVKKIHKDISNDLGVNINFRRIEKVGPKVSKELINAGIIAISL